MHIDLSNCSDLTVTVTKLDAATADDSHNEPKLKRRNTVPYTPLKPSTMSTTPTPKSSDNHSVNGSSANGISVSSNRLSSMSSSNISVERLDL